MKEPTFFAAKARGTSSAFSYVERTAPPYTEEVMEMAAPCVQGWRNRNNCDCPPCKDWQSETMYGTRSAKAQSGWEPRTVGSIDGHEVTFRQGYGENEGHTLISDGQKSARAFDREHNHYGPKREGGGRVEDSDGDRGYYTGPGR